MHNNLQEGCTMEITEKNMRNRGKVVFIVLVCMLAVLFLASICIGRYTVAPFLAFKILLSCILPLDSTWGEIEQAVVMEMRLPRALMAMLIGAGLSAGGASFQGLLGNPLVSPHILGVSAGAGFGAALGILISGNMFFIQGMALIFGIAAVVATWLISRLKSGSQLFMLILAGVITGALFEALISLIKYVADPEQKLPAIVFWLMGSMSGITRENMGLGIPLILLGIITLLLLRWKINILSLSDDEARSLGVDIVKLRIAVIGAATLITAVSVSICGIIGWVGLVVPHISRMIVGNDYKALLPASAAIGALYLLLIDNIARAATAAEIPLSILTAILGAPFFIFLLRKTGGNWK